ncbi:MAG: DUF2892 domain-containing protein [Chitinophagaceae bacterium]|nr:DUF2892 domain-containing protein [Chitinophagaceae bacterium]
MKKNMGTADRFIRIILAIVFFYLYYTNVVTGVFGIVLLVIGGIFLLTSIIGSCPLYSLIGIKTCSTKKAG